MPPRTRHSSKRVRHEVTEQNNSIRNQRGPALLDLDSNINEEPTLSPTTNNVGPDGPSVEGLNQIQASSGPIVNESANNKKNRVRGPTFMPKTWGIQPEHRVPVSFNELGQPNDEDKSHTLAHFLGVLARNPKYCPLDYDDWRHMPEQFKEDMKAAVKSRFGLSEAHDDFILTSINDKWRKWKSRVKKSNFKTGISLQQQKLNWSYRVDEDKFMNIAKHWSSDKAKKISEINKDSRAQLVDVHHMGKRSYAINREIMKKELGRYPNRAEMYERCFSKATCDVVKEDIAKMKALSTEEPQISYNGILHNEDDEFAKVKGSDKYGQVRMYGLGVRANDVYGKKPTRASLLKENMKYKEVLDKLTIKVEKLKARDSGNSHTVVEHDVESNQTTSPIRQPNLQRSSLASENNKVSSTSTSSSRRITAGSYVVLKSLLDSSEIVVAGYVREMGGVRVNGMTLGPAFYNVQVQSIYKKEEPLAFPYDHIRRMEDAIGAPVAWPFTSIALDDDDN